MLQLVLPGDGLTYGVLIACVGFLVALSTQRTELYSGGHGDFPIIFEGAYRLYCGQVPYRDFGMPVGPVSFLLPALFFKWLGPVWSSLVACQLTISAATLAALQALLWRLRASRACVALSLVSFAGLYLSGLSFHPWYNTTALLGLFVVSVLALGDSFGAVVTAGLMAGLCVLTKQDFGAIALGIGTCLVGLVAWGTDFETILISHTNASSAPRLRRLMGRLGVFWGSALLPVLITASATDMQAFAYWFNYGQPPHAVLRQGITAYYFLFLLLTSTGTLVMVLALQRDSLRLLVAAMFFGAGAMTSHLSGQLPMHFYAVGFVPLVLFELFTGTSRHRLPLLVLVTWVLMFFCLPAFANARFVWKLTLNYQAHGTLGGLPLSLPSQPRLVPFGNRLTAFQGPVLAPEETTKKLTWLLDELERRKGAFGKAPAVLNISEMSPIYAQLGQAPPIGFPLWFHPGISLFERELKHYEKTLSHCTYDAILLQTRCPEASSRLLPVLQRNTAYKLADRIQLPPLGAPILLFLRR
ncbi:MAG: hypothetical protein VKP62_05320 [Candidatus Sericytochromatia bacterium]|nr:hypothetical protein [Candidatus Sericytochromatia bacterium]